MGRLAGQRKGFTSQLGRRELGASKQSRIVVPGVALALLLAYAAMVSFQGSAAIPSQAVDYDVVIVGAGGGGLAAAARLTRLGKKVLVVERLDRVGGYMSGFDRGPYRFELSLHAMDGLDEEYGMNVATFRDLGIWDKVKRIKLDPMYRGVYPDLVLDIPADLEAYQRLLKEKFPHEAEGIDSLIYEFRRLNDVVAYSSDTVGRFIKGLVMDPWAFVVLARNWNRTLSEMIRSHVADQRLFMILTQLAGFTGTEPDKVSAVFFSVMWWNCHAGGFYYFEGGSHSVAEAMAEVIKEGGGEILLSTTVAKIVVENGRATGVVTEDGRSFRSRYVVSNVSVPVTVNDLVGPEHLPEEYVERVATSHVGTSLIVLYLGVQHDYRSAFPAGSHEIMVNPSYDQATNFRYSTAAEIEYVAYTIVNYSMVDPGVAPEGGNVIEITALLPPGWGEAGPRGDAMAKRAAETLIRRAERFLPGLGEHVEIMEVATPQTLQKLTRNPGGAILGWDNRPSQSILGRFPQTTPIDGLLLAGAWTFPSGGQSAVMLSGLRAADMILDREG